MNEILNRKDAISQAPLPVRQTLALLESLLIRNTVFKVQGRLAKAGRLLGIPRATLYRRFAQNRASFEGPKPADFHDLVVRFLVDYVTAVAEHHKTDPLTVWLDFHLDDVAALVRAELPKSGKS